MVDKDMEELETTGFLDEQVLGARKRLKTTNYLPFLAFSTIVNIFLISIAVFLYFGNAGTAASTYETGFDTDLSLLKSQIQLNQRRFTGGVEIHGSEFAVDDSDDSGRYAGPPSDRIDHAWWQLLGGLNIDLDPSKIDLEGKTIRWPDSGDYFTGLEVYHSLHCLNRIRQALYPSYYTDIFSSSTDPDREGHISHCINHLRQALQCHADLTPMQWKLEGNRVILKTDTLHTCRDFEKVHEWAKQRTTVKGEAVRNGSLIIVD